MVLHTIWQFCSPHLKTGSLGRPWKQQGCASAQRCSAELCAVSQCSSTADRPWQERGLCGAVPGRDTQQRAPSVPPVARAAAPAAAGQPLEGRREPLIPVPGTAGGAPGTAWLSTEGFAPSLGMPAPPGAADIQRCSLGRSVRWYRCSSQGASRCCGGWCPETGLDGAETCPRLVCAGVSACGAAPGSVHSLPLA